MRSEWTVAGGILGVVIAVVLLVALTNGCGGECNWKNGCRLDAAPAALVSEGCALPDAGPEVDDCFVNPLGGAGGCP